MFKSIEKSNNEENIAEIVSSSSSSSSDEDHPEPKHLYAIGVFDVPCVHLIIEDDDEEEKEN
jgi:hypothetical protein